MKQEAGASTLFGRLKLYLALSRTPHGVLDLATPIAAMLLWLGGFPPLSIVLLGLITVFAGYTAIYAVNDIVDYKTDKASFHDGARHNGSGYLDAIFIRHPLAQGFLTLGQAKLWALFWGGIAFIGAWLLNPVCAFILLLGAGLETLYCKLHTVTHLRALINGIVKTLGPMAAVLAVAPAPDFSFMLLLFLWVFLWEIGGQNIPADWHDIELDARQGARTIPVALGPDRAGRLALNCLTASLLVSIPLLTTAPLDMHWLLMILAVAWGWRLTVAPARKLDRTNRREDASLLFNRASWYPAATLAAILVSVIF